MLKRTHIALGLVVGLYFLPHINSNKFIFLAIALLSSILPDIESGFLAPKRSKILTGKPVFHKNRLLHTYTFLIPATFVIALYWPTVALPFFLGYSFHLFIDSFSPQGIRPFWPLKSEAKGRVAPGGAIDKILFYIFLGLIIVFVIGYLFFLK